MIPRRTFCFAFPSVLSCAGKLAARDRVDRALQGRDVDRPPYTCWYHFLDEDKPAAHHAAKTLEFHHKFSTDLVKVMSDYPYPKPKGQWWEARVEQNPFPAQIQALELIRDGLKGSAHFVETIFNPWNQATKISSKDEVLQLMTTQPQRLLTALEAIARSEAAHARKAIACGASGIFLAIDNAQDGVLTGEQYRRFSEPFDRMVLDAVRDAPLNVLHLHGDKVRVDHFLKGWPAAAINYSPHGTRVPVAKVRAAFDGVILAGLDEVHFRKLTPQELRRQIASARLDAGAKWILTPGCSVPNDTADAEILKLVKLLG
jgi:uroporphyrinogen decarboxylase